MMQGIIANLVINAGRSLINDIASPKSSGATTPDGSQSFAAVMQSQGLREASSIQDILAIKPDMSDSELMQISQSLKTQIVQSQMGLHGEKAPLNLGEWTFEKSTHASGESIIRVTDVSGKSMQIDQFSPTYKQVNLLQQIDEHLKLPHSFSTL